VGWVIVRPGYSTEPAVRASGETNNRVTRRVWQRVNTTGRIANPMILIKTETAEPRTETSAGHTRFELGMALGKEASQSPLQGTSKGKGKPMPKPWWCSVGLSKTQRRWLQKLRKKELEEGKGGKVA
jgi:hypothetical protein